MRAYEDRWPSVHATTFVAPGAWVVGDVEIGPRSSVWFGAVVRGDSDRVSIGAETNVQDGAVLHTDPGKSCTVGDRCTIGHRAVVHACTVGDDCLIGMGSVVLTGAVVGSGSLVAAGAVVPEGMEVPPRSVVAGVPAAVKRTLTAEEMDRLIRPGARNYLRYVEGHRGTDLEETDETKGR